MNTLSSPGPDRRDTGAADVAGPGLPDDAWRWGTCLHESGHACYAILECCAVPAYLIATSQAGLCGNVRTVGAWRAGIFAAVGPIAGALPAPRPERIAPPPAAWAFLPHQIRTPDAVLAVAVGCLSDEEETARCVVAGAFATCPDLWAGRHADMLKTAADFVESNRAAIVAVATKLFQRGAMQGCTAAALIGKHKGAMTP